MPAQYLRKVLSHRPLAIREAVGRAAPHHIQLTGRVVSTTRGLRPSPRRVAGTPRDLPCPRAGPRSRHTHSPVYIRHSHPNRCHHHRGVLYYQYCHYV